MGQIFAGQKFANPNGFVDSEEKDDYNQNLKLYETVLWCCKVKFEIKQVTRQGPKGWNFQIQTDNNGVWCALK